MLSNCIVVARPLLNVAQISLTLCSLHYVVVLVLDFVVLKIFYAMEFVVG